MKWAILSDVHGNLDALEPVVLDLRREGAEQVAFLGDAVGYGAEPNECLAWIRQLTRWAVAGNHDWGAVGLTDIEGFNPAAHAAIVWTGENLTGENAAYLRGLRLSLKKEEITFVHASPEEPGEWHYLISFPEAEEGFRALAGDLAFVGHSHRPLALMMEGNGEVKVVEGSRVSLRPGVRYIINVGSVGQPRDGNPEAAYGLYDDSKKEYILKRVPYNLQAAQKKILKAGLPPFLARRLSRGM